MNNRPFIAALCQNIKRLRMENNLTKTGMAQIIGISVGDISRIENGVLPPRLAAEHLGRLSAHFRISLADLFLPIEEKKTERKEEST